MRWRVGQGDALSILRRCHADRFDALVTDPPAGIGFMGKSWDKDRGGSEAWIAWLAAIMAEVLRVLKPGAHGLVWALPRTSHWTATALERSGFEIRDRVSHFFGTGFPKSLDLGFGIGTALKPAVEDWWLVRKPISESSIAANLARWGTGGLSIDDCRIGVDARINPPTELGVSGGVSMAFSETGGDRKGSPVAVTGRWPAHLVLDEEAGAILDQEAGDRGGGWGRSGGDPNGGFSTGRAFPRGDGRTVGFGDSGGPSRFFYCSKTTTAEREKGLEAFSIRTPGELTGGRAEDSAGLSSPRAGAGRSNGRRNHHPTVKPIELMRWLVRLVSRPGHVILDPFAGTGSTLIAAKLEGRGAVGIEQDAEYVTIARARIEAWEIE